MPIQLGFSERQISSRIHSCTLHKPRLCRQTAFFRGKLEMRYGLYKDYKW